MFSRKQLNLSVLTPEFLDANTFINDENIKKYADNPEQYNKVRIELLHQILKAKNKK